jgi:hypothetical protein
MKSKYNTRKITGITTAFFNVLVSPSMCIKAQTIKYAFTNVRIMNNQFNKLIAIKLFM